MDSIAIYRGICRHLHAHQLAQSEIPFLKSVQKLLTVPLQDSMQVNSALRAQARQGGVAPVDPAEAQELLHELVEVVLAHADSFGPDTALLEKAAQIMGIEPSVLHELLSHSSPGQAGPHADTDRKGAFHEGLDLLRQVLSWLHRNPSVQFDIPIVARLEPSILKMRVNPRNEALAHAASLGTVVTLTRDDLDWARRPLRDLQGTHADGPSYLDALTGVLLAFYVSESVYRLNQAIYSEFVGLMTSYVGGDPQRLTPLQRMICEYIVKDLNDVGMSDLGTGLGRAVRTG